MTTKDMAALVEHSCYHCDKPIDWIWTSENGKELRNICDRCATTLEPYMGSSGKQFSVVHDCDRQLAKDIRSNDFLCSSRAKEGDWWKCSCGRTYEHYCSEAEGCGWQEVKEEIE